MNKCIFYTMAYNAEKTLVRTIDSILAQTVENWVWYLLDNGSTDRTGEIIKEYAQRDSRIIFLKNKRNYIFDKGNDIMDVIENHDDDDYLAWIDADDEYKSQFLEKMLEFVHKYNLDVAACGFDFIEVPSGKLLDERKLKGKLILDTPERYGQYFPLYFRFMRTNWCKLISIGVMRQYGQNRSHHNLNLRYGADAQAMIEVFRIASRVGIYPDSLHRYYRNQSSSSHYLDEYRIVADRIVDDMARSFLIDKCGTVDLLNDRFISSVYYMSLKDTIGIIINAELNFIEQANYFQDIFSHEKTKRLTEKDFANADTLFTVLYKPVLEWFFAYNKPFGPEEVEASAKMLIAMYPNIPCRIEALQYLLVHLPQAVEYILTKEYNRVLKLIEIWHKKSTKDILLITELEINLYHELKKPDVQLFDLYMDIKKYRPKCSDELNIELYFTELFSKYPLLNNISIDLAISLSNTIKCILQSNMNQALEEFVVALETVDIAEEHRGSYIILGQNLAAAVENIELYVLFSKEWISYLIDYSRNSEAEKTLNEFDQMLPGDKDLALLRQRLMAQLN